MFGSHHKCLKHWLRMGAASAILLLCAGRGALAQVGGGFVAPTDAMDTLNEAPVGGGGAGQIGLERAQNLPGAPGMTPGFPGAPPPGVPGMANVPGAQTAMKIVKPVIPKIKVITGTRVFDAVTGELLDDAREKAVAETDKENFFDDGTHGDLTADDGKYTKTDQRNDVLGQSNQRVKEQLVQALVVAENLNPLEFYGFSLMSTERQETVPRNRAWRLTPDPKGGPGLVLAEEAVEKPLTVPKYRKWQSEKDSKVKEDWSLRFLQEYRKNRDSLTSEFFPIYIPLPPPAPAVAPPGAQAAWMPFGQGGSAKAGAGADAQGGMSGNLKSQDVTGEPIGNASSRYF
jgi:hypothetical protein